MFEGVASGAQIGGLLEHYVQFNRQHFENHVPPSPPIVSPTPRSLCSVYFGLGDLHRGSHFRLSLEKQKLDVDSFCNAVRNLRVTKAFNPIFSYSLTHFMSFTTAHLKLLVNKISWLPMLKLRPLHKTGQRFATLALCRIINNAQN